jgi:hypothetical protein
VTCACFPFSLEERAGVKVSDLSNLIFGEGGPKISGKNKVVQSRPHVGCYFVNELHSRTGRTGATKDQATVMAASR